MHGAARREHACGGKLVGGAGHVEIVTRTILILSGKGVGTDAGHHAPGGHFHAVKGQGQQQGENVHIVHVVGLIVIAMDGVIPAGKVVVPGASPESGEAHVFIELVAGHHAGHVVIENVAAGGHAGQGDALDAHAHLQVGLGHHPVNVGVLQLHHIGVVSAQGAAGVVLAPGLGADFKEHGAGQGLGSHGVQLQAHTLLGFEFVLALVRLVGLVEAGHAVAAGKAAVLAIVEAHDPLAFGLEINGAGAGSSTEHQARRQQKRSDLFHG